MPEDVPRKTVRKPRNGKPSALRRDRRRVAPGGATGDHRADAPVPVRVVAQKIGEWIARLGEVWVDGQIAQLTRRPGVPTQFLTLRDPDANISLTVTCPRSILADAISEGSRVVCGRARTSGSSAAR